ncbi:LacI family DNA-binding transcriptional regulator [Paenibacillus popilliae]|uniref:LacI family transcriptional regulator n=1 Tax=Paenibacillus popilliae TaxID=78057 RepID=A0ABY3AVI5_PAEPP|nr:LacI family DNA-binding transcriptional regulator [Paenibacillus sp. SDF0028]TQR46426.1 LacI family transcriptional regulator [Paenibacillus sp. SDF0028]
MNNKTIAQMAGVSLSTVSKIINNYSDVSEETRNRVLEIMRREGYTPTPSLKKSNLIVVIFAGKQNVEFTHPFFIEVLNSFKKQIGLLGYDLLFLTNTKAGDEESDYLSRCQAYQVAGCIIISGQDLEPSIDALDQSDIPCLGVDIKLTGKNSGYIMSDNYKLTSKVVEHFYLLGYRDLGYIGSSTSSSISNIRETGYRDAMEALGLTINPEWFVNGSDFFEQSGYDAMQQILKAETLPRAIFAASDLIAIGAMRAIQERKLKVPEDIAIIGCDDIDASKYIQPSLTTMRQNKEKLGILSALMLHDLINNQSSTSSFVVEPELVIRNSCDNKNSGYSLYSAMKR